MLWMILGLAIGIGGFWVMTIARTRKIRVAWYDWFIGAMAVVLALLALQNFLGSFEELEPRAAWVMFAMFGVPALILAGLTGYLVWRENKPASVSPQN